MLGELALEHATRVTPEVVDYICQQIVQAVAPEKIVVFGSVARDEMREGSDLDLLVVVPGSPATDCRQIARKIDALFFGRRFGMDILVRTDEQIKDYVQRGRSFYVKDIFTDGRVLYDRSNRK